MDSSGRISESEFACSIEQRLSDCRLFESVAVANYEDGLLVVVNPHLKRIWDAGSADLESIVRMQLSDVFRSIGSDESRTRIAITQAQLPSRPAKGFRDSDLLPFFNPAPAAENEAAKPDSTDLVDASELNKLWQFLQWRFPGRHLIRQTCPRLELGLDSLDWLELLLAVEEHTGIGLSEDVASRVITLGDLESALIASSSSQGEESLRARKGALLDAPQLDKSMRPRNRASRSLGLAIYGFNCALFRCWFKLEIRGLSNLPRAGSFILAPNHVSDLDVPAILATLPKDRLEEYAWGGNRERLFATAFSRFLCHLGHVFPLDDRLPLTGLAVGIGCLRQGRPVVWYPESWRSPDGRIQPLKRGIGILSLETGVPILPVIIDGTFEALPRHETWPRRHSVRVHIASPRHPWELERQGEGEDTVARIVDGLRRSLEDLQAAVT